MAACLLFGRALATALGASGAGAACAHAAPLLPAGRAACGGALPSALMPATVQALWRAGAGASVRAHSLSTAAAPAAVASADAAADADAFPLEPAAAPALPAHMLEPKPELVDLFLSPELRGAAVQRRLERRRVAADFGRHPADSGSPQVMAALMTHRVRSLVRHFDDNPKQLGAMRDLEILAHQRRRMLTWLRSADFASYAYTIAKLGLRDVYTPVGASDRYREGLRHGDPLTDDGVRRWRFSFHPKFRVRKAALWARLRPQLVEEDPVLAAADAAAAADTRRQRLSQRRAAAEAAAAAASPRQQG